MGRPVLVDLYFIVFEGISDPCLANFFLSILEVATMHEKFLLSIATIKRKIT